MPIYEDYKVPSHLRPATPKGSGITWGWLMEHWQLVQADLMEIYGVRDDQAHTYSGPWYVGLVWNLLTTPKSRVFREWQAENK